MNLEVTPVATEFVLHSFLVISVLQVRRDGQSDRPYMGDFSSSYRKAIEAVCIHHHQHPIQLDYRVAYLPLCT